jgi:hypothetical protein
VSYKKICEGCGEEYLRPTGPNRITDERWEARRFCNARCGLHAAGKSSDGKGAGQKEAGYDMRMGAAVGSNALRERIIAMFARTANANGISLEEAARLHLCPKAA